MSDEARTREEIYAAVRKTSRDEVILDEMIRLGFWPAKDKMPEDPADEIRRRGELQRMIGEARAKHRKLNDEEHLIKEARRQRLAESRRKQQETRERRERERLERAEAWRLQKER